MPRVRLIRSSVDFQWGIEVDLGSIVLGYSVQDGSFTAPPGDDLVLESFDRLNIHHIVTVDATAFRNAGQLYIFGGPDPQLTINAPVTNEVGGLIRIFDDNGNASLTAPNSITNLGTIEVAAGGILITPALNNSGSLDFSGAALTASTAINNAGDLYLTGNDVGDTLITTPQLNNSDYLSVTPTVFAEFAITAILNTGVIDVVGGPWVLAGVTNNTYGGGGQLNGVLDGGDGSDTLIGGVFADSFAGGAGTDSLSGGDGGDTLAGGANNDTLNGGNGVDTASYATAPATVVVNLLAGSADDGQGGVDTLISIEQVLGSGFRDSLTGDNNANALDGWAGNDDLFGLDGADALLGGPGNDLLVGGPGNDTINGGEDVDTVDYSGAGGGVDANLGIGRANNDGQGGFDLLSQVENIIGTGSADLLDGDSGGNILTGNGGNDRLRGAGGNDLLIGGAGIDTLEGGDGGDTLQGGSEGDILDGGSSADAMTGGLGDDLYLVDDAGDTITELASEGFDQVLSSVSFTLAANVDMLTLTGSAFSGTGNSTANQIVGGGVYNELYGMGGNDRLLGMGGGDILDGGTGADEMIGGTGDDLYVVDNAGDTTTELSGEGFDQVLSSVSFTLAANVDMLTLTGSAFSGTGNSTGNQIVGTGVYNELYGLGGNDRLIGMGGGDILDGGAGADEMIGGTGDDRYIVDDAGDILTELSGEGFDQVVSSVSFTLAANVDMLTLTGSAFSGTGNSTANQIVGAGIYNELYGLGGNDRLIGMGGGDILDGGTGADDMVGGLGDDLYIVDNAGDTTTELSGEGFDQVSSSVSFTLAANVDMLTLIGSADINATGNSAANQLAGNSGANQLNGMGGSDRVTGGAGADAFVFSTALGAGNLDEITDFSVADDTIHLDRIIFTAINAGTLDADAFHIGAAAADAEDRIVYNSATGALFYDADGSGAGAAVQFATLAAGLALTQADFLGFGP